MGVGIIYAFSFKPNQFAVCIKQIVCIVYVMTAFEKNRTMIVVSDMLCRGNHIIFGFNGQFGENLCFGDIWGDKSGNGQ